MTESRVVSSATKIEVFGGCCARRARRTGKYGRALHAVQPNLSARARCITRHYQRVRNACRGQRLRDTPHVGRRRDMHHPEAEYLWTGVIVVMVADRPTAIIVCVGVTSERRLSDYVARRKKRKRSGLLMKVARRGVQPEVCVARPLSPALKPPSLIRARETRLRRLDAAREIDGLRRAPRENESSR